MAQNMDSSTAVENSVNASGLTSNITVTAIFTKTSGEYAGDSPQWKIYVNGSAVNSGTYNFNYPSPSSGTKSYTIGTWTGNVSNPVGGGSCTWECRFEGNKHPLSNESSWFTTGSKTLNLSTIRTISYDKNGGSTTPSMQYGVQGTSITLASSISRSGGTDSRTVTINYNNNGGSGAMTATTASQSGSYSYSFAGWNTNSSGTGTNYSASGSYTVPSSNSTLYAKWTQNATTWADKTVNTATNTFTHSNGSDSRTVTIKYNNNGGSGTMSDTTASQSGSYPYTFGGWKVSNSGSVVTSYTFGNNSTTSVTMYAQWSAGTRTWSSKTVNTATNTFTHADGTTSKTITVTYNNNGGSGFMSNSTGTCSGSYPYTFGGWKVSNSGSVVTSYTFGNNDTTSVTMYAQWTAGTTQYTNTTISLRTNSFTKNKYTFANWNSNSNGTGTTYTTSYTGQSDITIYAQWILTKTIRYYNGSTFTSALYPYIWNGTTWKRGTAYIWNGTTWKQGKL